MTDFLPVCGQVRAQESRLLTLARLDRMIGAASPEEAFRILVELQYAEYFDESTVAKDFAKVIERGLWETKEILVNGTDHYAGLKFLWQRFDVNNLKRALKMKLVEEETEISDFSEDNGFNVLGDLDQVDLGKIVFDGQNTGEIPISLFSVVQKAEDILKSSGEFQAIEWALDRVHFEVLGDIVEETGDAFLAELLDFIIDSVNFRIVARSILVREEAIPSEAWVEGGNLYFSDVEKLTTAEEFYKWASRTSFETAVNMLPDSESDIEKMMRIEKNVDKIYGTFVADRALGVSDSIVVPISYFERRLQNARLIKFVMFAKFHGLDADKIYSALEHF